LHEQLLAPDDELEPVGHAVQDVAELPAAEYVSAPQLTHEAEEPEPETIFPAAAQLHVKLSPAPVHEKPSLAVHELAPDDELEPVGHAVQDVAELPAAE
jgi:hypothetical protein